MVGVGGPTAPRTPAHHLLQGLPVVDVTTVDHLIEVAL